MRLRHVSTVRHITDWATQPGIMNITTFVDPDKKQHSIAPHEYGDKLFHDQYPNWDVKH